MEVDGIITSTSSNIAAMQKKRTSNGGLAPNSIYSEVIEKKRQQFKALFNETGIVDIISQVLNALYKEKEWPKNPKDFIGRHFSTILNGGKDPEQLCQELRQENERIRLENAEMEDISDGLTNQFPPVFDADISMDEEINREGEEVEEEEQPPAIEPLALDPVPTKVSTPKVTAEIPKVIPKPASPKVATPKMVQPPAPVITEAPDPVTEAPDLDPIVTEHTLKTEEIKPAKPIDLSNPTTMTWADMERMMEEDRAKEAAEQKAPPKKSIKKKEETPEELEKKKELEEKLKKQKEDAEKKRKEMKEMMRKQKAKSNDETPQDETF